MKKAKISFHCILNRHYNLSPRFNFYFGYWILNFRGAFFFWRTFISIWIYAEISKNIWIQIIKNTFSSLPGPIGQHSYVSNHSEHLQQNWQTYISSIYKKHFLHIFTLFLLMSPTYFKESYSKASFIENSN